MSVQTQPDDSPTEEAPVQDDSALPMPDDSATVLAAPAQVSGAFDNYQLAAPASAIARASLATTPAKEIKRYSTSLGIPESDFAMAGGNVVRRVPDSQLPPQLRSAGNAFARVRPSVFGGPWSEVPGRALDWAASGVGPAIPQAAGIVGAALTAPTLGGMAIGGAGFAAPAELSRQWLDSALAGEDFHPDWWNVAGQAALAGSAPYVGAAIGKGAALAGSGAEKAARFADNVAVASDSSLASTVGPTWQDMVQPAADWLKAMGEDRNPLQLNQPSFRKLQDRLDPQELANIGALRQEAAREGIDLDLHQLTGARSFGVRMRQLLRYPETMDDAAEFTLGQRTQQIPQAFLGKVNELLPAGSQLSPEDAINAFRGAANNIVQSTLDERSALAKSAYDAAVEDAPGTTVQDTITGKNVKVPDRFWNPQVEALMDSPAGAKAVANAQKIWSQDPDVLLNPELKGKQLNVPTYDGNGNLVGDTFAPDWRSWKYITAGMNQEYKSTLDQYGRTNPYGRNVLRTMNLIKNQLWDANPALRSADAMYGDASDAVSAVLNGGPGFLQSMKGLDRQQILDRVFSGTNIMPQDVDKLHGMFSHIGANDEWDSAASAWLRGKLNDALTPYRTGGEPGNVAGVLYQGTFGTPEDQRMMKAIFGNDAKFQKYARFMDVMKAASRYMPEGSPTATDLPEMQSGVGKAVNLVGKVFSPETYLNLGQNLTEGLQNTFDQNMRTRLLNYMITPEGDQALAAMARVTPQSAAARRLLGQVFLNAGLVSAGGRGTQPSGVPQISMVPKTTPLTYPQ